MALLALLITHSTQIAFDANQSQDSLLTGVCLTGIVWTRPESCALHRPAPLVETCSTCSTDPKNSKADPDIRRDFRIFQAKVVVKLSASWSLFPLAAGPINFCPFDEG